MSPRCAHLKRALVFDGPHTDADGHDGDEDKRNEDEEPENLRTAVLQLVTCQQLKHEQQHMHARTQDHALVVGVRLPLQSTNNTPCLYPHTQDHALVVGVRRPSSLQTTHHVYIPIHRTMPL